MMKIKKRNPKIVAESNNVKDWLCDMRGIEKEIRDSFFSPTIKDTYSPFDLNNMQKVVSKVKDTINKNGRIYIDLDVDCDGVTSASQLYLYLKNFTENVFYIIKQRFDGHGVRVDKIPEDADLLIIVDSSTNSIDECRQLSKRCDIIILDHHPKENDNPYALIVNPMLGGYKNPSLSGSAVVFKFCQAYDKLSKSSLAMKYVDLAAIGLIGDMMKLNVLENRYIVLEGLKLLNNKSGNLGIQALSDKTLKGARVVSESIGYYLAPCINAVIRMGDLGLIMELLTCNSKERADELSEEVINLNNRRKDLTEKMFDYIKDKNMITNDKVIIINMSDSGFSKNLFGLVANKISQEYGRPCLFGSVNEGYFQGSARSYGYEVDLKTECVGSKKFEYALGHESSFGVKIKAENLQSVTEYFNNKFKNKFKEKSCQYDFKIDIKYLSIKLLDDIDEACLMCGVGFGKPKFLIENISVDYYSKIGDKNNHTKLTKKDGDSYINIMKFNTVELLDEYKKAKSINVVGSVGVNRYYSKEKKKTYISKQILSDIITCNK